MGHTKKEDVLLRVGKIECHYYFVICWHFFIPDLEFVQYLEFAFDYIHMLKYVKLKKWTHDLSFNSLDSLLVSTIMFTDHFRELLCFGVGWVEWFPWNPLWPRIWCQNVQDNGSLSPDLLHYIAYLRCPRVCSVVVFRHYPHFTTTRSSNRKLGRSVSQVLDSGAVCLWILAKYA